MANLKARSATVVTVLWLLCTLLLGFQNCSGGFAVDTAKLDSIRAASTFIDPSITISSPPAALIAMNSVSIALETTIDPKLAIRSINCSLNSADWSACPQPLAFANLADGNYALNIELTDSRGMTAKTSATWTIDVTKPTTTFNLKPGALSGASVDFQFTAADNLSGVTKLECALDSEAYAACTSPVKKTALAAGDHKFGIRATDKAGNISLANEVAWTVDLTAPVVTISAAPAAFVNSQSASFSFSATAKNSTISLYECDLDAGGFTACTSPKTYANLTEQKHTFTVRATGALNGLQASIASTWTIDLTPPTAPNLVTTLTKYSALNTGTFMFTSSDGTGSGVASYTCTLDGAASTCTSPKSYSLSEGVHNFAVFATDAAGNKSTASTFSWTTDFTPPTTPVISAGPNAYTKETTATFVFSATDALSGIAVYQCTLDTGTAADCTSPKTFSALGEGAHALKIRALDLAGNASGFTTYNWTVDNTPPTLPVITTSTTTPYSRFSQSTFGYTSTDSGSGISAFECQEDGGTFVACGSSYQMYGADGRHSFGVRAKDVLGNTSNVATFTWTIDTQGPILTFTQIPAKVESSGTSTFKFSLADASGSRVTAKCSWLNSEGETQSGEDCSTGMKTYTNLTPSHYGINIMVTDEAGNSNSNLYEWDVAVIVPLTPAPPVAIGMLSMCASVGGSAKCWGEQGSRPLPVDRPGFSTRPITIPGLETGVTQVMTDGAHQYCAIVNGGVKCAYYGSTGYLETAKAVPGLASGITSIATRSIDDGFVVKDGALIKWNFASYSDFSYTLSTTFMANVSSGVQAVAASETTVCIIQNGFVFCDWNGAQAKVPKLYGVSQIAVRNGGGCALKNGGVWCWGENSYGELGDPAYSLQATTATPISVPGFESGVTAISAWRWTVCAVKAGSTYCWGNVQKGQMVSDSVEYVQNSVMKVPTLLPGYSAGSVASVAVGLSNTCLIMRDTSLMCLGDNYWGQLGNGTVDDSAIPIVVPGLTGLVAQ